MGSLRRSVSAAGWMFGSDEGGAEDSAKEENEDVSVVLVNETPAVGEEGMLCAAKERERSSSPSVEAVEVVVDAVEL